jgi:hypothetical protein
MIFFIRFLALHILSLKLLRDLCAPNFSMKLSFMVGKSLSFLKEKIFPDRGRCHLLDLRKCSILITEAGEEFQL